MTTTNQTNYPCDISCKLNLCLVFASTPDLSPNFIFQILDECIFITNETTMAATSLNRYTGASCLHVGPLHASLHYASQDVLHVRPHVRSGSPCMWVHTYCASRVPRHIMSATCCAGRASTSREPSIRSGALPPALFVGAGDHRLFFSYSSSPCFRISVVFLDVSANYPHWLDIRSAISQSRFENLIPLVRDRNSKSDLKSSQDHNIK